MCRLGPVALSPKQERFIEEYLLDLNAKQAAIRAGYAPGSAEVQGSRLLRIDKVRHIIDERKSARAEKFSISAERVLGELKLLATCDIGGAFNTDGSLKPLHEIPEEVRRAISGVEVDELYEGHGKEREQVGYTRKVKFWSKPDCLIALGKHLKLFTERIEHTGKVTLEQLVAPESTPKE